MRVIRYVYNTWVDNCGCCSWSSSTYELWENGIEINRYREDSVECCENEGDLRKYLSHLEPFEVDPDSRWW